jgi:hypothetical protein
LTAEQSDLALQLDKVKQEASAQGMLAAATDTAGIIQPAIPATGSGRLGSMLTWAFAGAVLGAAGAAGVMLFRIRRDPRLRARDDLADAVGGNVLADVRSRPQRSVAEWSALFESYDPPAVDAWALRQVLRALAALQNSADPDLGRAVRAAGRVDHPRSLSVVSLAGDNRGVVVGPQLAVFAASLGISTRLVISSPQGCPASLWAACTAERGSTPRPGLVLETGARSVGPYENGSAGIGGQMPPETGNGHVLASPDGSAGRAADSDVPDQHGTEQLVSRVASLLGEDSGHTWLQEGDYEWFGTGIERPRQEWEPGDPGRRFEPAHRLAGVAEQRSVDLTIVLTVTDAKEPMLLGEPATAVTMLAISPGVASREELARLAVAVDDAGRRIDGIVVADPDPSDRTTGRRTLDERARHAPLPLRVTGISQVTMPATDPGQGR